jgi:hypothetical protein
MKISNGGIMNIWVSGRMADNYSHVVFEMSTE